MCMGPAQASESHYNIFPSLLATTTIRSQLWLRIFHKKVGFNCAKNSQFTDG